MIETTLGGTAAFFLLLPFLLIVYKLVKIRKTKRYILSLLLFFVVLGTASAALLYSTFRISNLALIGALMVYGGYAILFLVILIVRRYKYVKLFRAENANEELEEYEIFQENGLPIQGAVSEETLVLKEEDIFNTLFGGGVTPLKEEVEEDYVVEPVNVKSDNIFNTLFGSAPPTLIREEEIVPIEEIPEVNEEKEVKVAMGEEEIIFEEEDFSEEEALSELDFAIFADDYNEEEVEGE